MLVASIISLPFVKIIKKYIYIYLSFMVNWISTNKHFLHWEKMLIYCKLLSSRNDLPLFLLLQVIFKGYIYIYIFLALGICSEFGSFNICFMCFMSWKLYFRRGESYALSFTSCMLYLTWCLERYWKNEGSNVMFARKMFN